MRDVISFWGDSARAMRQWRVWSYLALSDLKGRFARTMLGYSWIVISFAIWAAGVGLVYARLFELDTREFVPFLTIGFAMWGYLTASFVESSGALISAAGYVKQFGLPKQVYILRSILTQVISFMLAMAVSLVVTAVVGKLTFSGVIYALPGLLLFLLAGLMHAFLSAYVTPYIRDFPHAVGSLLGVVFFLTPVIFPAELLQERGLGLIVELNPFFYLLDAVRAPLTSGLPPDPRLIGGAAAYVTVVGIIAGVVCARLDRRLVYAL